ncbi:MAG TPA: EamA family transporter [Candidatus Acidoferrales bacterium]|nr:EamA family transporter [Candidatus Acidoferrales bacterium]
MLREVILFSIIIIGGPAGEICMSAAMKRVGEVSDFRPMALLRVAARAAAMRQVWIGFALMALAFFGLLAMLSLENVSFVVPVTALSYAASAPGGRIFLGERITPQRWIGVALVCLGVALVCLGQG